MSPGPNAERLLALSAGLERRRRLVEGSVGGSLERKLAKLKEFGPRYLYWWLASRGLGWRRQVDVRLFWGRVVRLPLSMQADFVTLYLTGALGGPESKLIRYFIRTLEPSDVFYDVGAHYGFYTYLAAELIESGEIHAFEPMPEAARFLRLNAAHRARVNEFALAAKTGAQTLFVHSLGTSFSTLNEKIFEVDPARKGPRITVPCETIDDYVARHRPPTVMKVDVEGGEELVVAGGRSFLSSRAPIIAMEIWGEKGFRLSRSSIQALGELGYRPHALGEDGRPTSALSIGEVEAAMAGVPWDNFIFAKARLN